MKIIIGESWSGNWLVYYPSKNNWGVRKEEELEPCTDDDLIKAKEIIEKRSYLILNVQFEEN